MSVLKLSRILALLRLSVRTQLTLALIFLVSFGRIFYVTLLGNAHSDTVVPDGSAADVVGPLVELSPRCQLTLVEDELTVRSSRLKHDLLRGINECPDVRRPLPDSVRTNGRWQVQDTGDNKIVVYSAFYDDRPGVGVTPWIRILAVAKLAANTTHYCHIWYPGCSAPFVTEVVVNVTGRDGGYVINKVRYVQYLLSCRLAGAEPVPSHVSVVSSRCSQQSSIYLPVERPVRAEPDVEFGVCVAIAFGTIPVPVLVEWLELTWMLGAREFNIYDAGMVNMTDVFRYYERRGWLKVHDMPPPVPDLPNRTSLHTTGHVAAQAKRATPTLGSVKLASPASLNDCLLRNVYRYRYAVVIDFDELIVPRFHDNYEQMIAHIDRKYRVRARPYTYTFSNTYYFLSFAQDKTQPTYMRSLRYRRRVQPTGMASKSFVDPRWCLSVFNHYCLRPLRPPSTTLVHIYVSADIARSHHYRSCGFSNKTCTEYAAQQTQDDVTLRFRRRLLPTVELALRDLGYLPK